MKPERRLLWLGIGAVAAGLILSMLFFEAAEPETSYTARIQSNRLLFFKNIRSSGYDLIEGDGFQVYAPKERSDSGWYQIIVHWRADQAHILWVSGEALIKDESANLIFCEGQVFDVFPNGDEKLVATCVSIMAAVDIPLKSTVKNNDV